MHRILAESLLRSLMVLAQISSLLIAYIRLWCVLRRSRTTCSTHAAWSLHSLMSAVMTTLPIVDLLHRLKFSYQSVVQYARPGSEGTTVLTKEGGVEVDLEVDDDGYSPKRHIAGTFPQKLFVLDPAGHILVSALPDDVALRVLIAAKLADTVRRACSHLGYVPVVSRSTIC